MTLTYARIANRTHRRIRRRAGTSHALYHHGDKPADLADLRQEHRWDPDQRHTPGLSGCRTELVEVLVGWAVGLEWGTPRSGG
jgi:hypothetical protein